MTVAPTWVGTGTYASGTDQIVPGLPADWEPGDIWLLAVEFDSTDTPDIQVSDWTQIGSTQATSASATRTGLAVFYRRAGATEIDPIILDTGDHTSAIINGFRGCTLLNPPTNTFAGGSDATELTSVTLPDVTTTVDNCGIVLLTTHGVDTTSSNYSGWTNVNLTSLSELSDDSTDSGSGGGIGVAFGVMDTAGSVGTSQATLAVASSRAYMTVALAPLGDSESILVYDNFDREDTTSLTTTTSGHTWFDGQL